MLVFLGMPSKHAHGRRYLYRGGPLVHEICWCCCPHAEGVEDRSGEDGLLDAFRTAVVETALAAGIRCLSGTCAYDYRTPKQKMQWWDDASHDEKCRIRSAFDGIFKLDSVV